MHSSWVFDIETLSPQRGVDIGKDVIVAIGLTDGKDYWLQTIKPEKRGHGDVLLEEGNIIFSFCQELKRRKTKTLVGYNILGFDLPHILLKTGGISYQYQRRANKNLGIEVCGTFSGLQFIDLMYEYLKRTGGKWPKLGDLYQDLTGKQAEPVDRDEIYASSALAILGKPEKITKHLRTDLKETWEIYQWMKEKYKL